MFKNGEARFNMENIRIFESCDSILQFSKDQNVTVLNDLVMVISKLCNDGKML